jgi:hypothetical protein
LWQESHEEVLPIAEASRGLQHGKVEGRIMKDEVKIDRAKSCRGLCASR